VCWRPAPFRPQVERARTVAAWRHSGVTNVYRATRELFLAQRFARHVSPLTTTIYTHPSDQEMAERLRGLGC
jgi:integrase/recombinase XerC